MKKMLLVLLTLTAISVGTVKAQTIYENFAGDTAKQKWMAIDTASGAYLGVVANPKPNAVNPSAKCGAFRRNPRNAYSLMWTVHTTDSFDISVNNKFKIQVLSPIKGLLILKLEGSSVGKGSYETNVRMSPAGKWVEYTFDLSSVKTSKFKNLDLFFAAGSTSADTFYFGRIQALPADACSGVAPDPLVVDDFDCQRNASYDNGFDSLTVIANPDKTGINTSANVGQYHKPPHQSYDALVADYANPFNLSVNNFVYAKVWAPIPGIIKAKVEGGPKALEVDVNITAANTKKWVQLAYDFSAAAGNGNNRLVFFFDAGHDTAADLIYYIDDIKFGAKPALEDFDPTKLTWGPGDAANGTFSVIPNPVQDAVNGSVNIGQYIKGSGANGIVSAALPANFAIDSVLSQLNLQVLGANAGQKKVTMQLSGSALGGIISVEALLDPAQVGAWQNLGFDFTLAKGIKDFTTINLLFDAGTTASGSKYYFDNLSQSVSTLNPCKGIVPNITIANDFECQTYGVASLLTQDANSTLAAVTNPDQTGANTSLKVGRYIKTPKSGAYDAIVLDAPVGYDLSVNDQLSVMVWTRNAGKPIALKMEGPAGLEKDLTITKGGTWVEYIADFSSIKGKGDKRITLFGDLGVIPTGNDTFYFDNIKFKRAPIQGCALDFESTANTYNFTTFANGSLDANVNKPVPNPSKTGIDTSSTVGFFTRAKDGDPNFAGQYGDLSAPLQFGSNSTMTMKVYMPKIGNVSIKLEGAPGSHDGPSVANTKVNQWELLTFNMSSYDLTQPWTRVTIFFDFFIPTARDSTKNITYYFDDIAVGKATCGLVSGLFDVSVEKLSIFPNPAYNELIIDNAKDLTKIVVFNRIGQAVKTYNVSPNDTNIRLDVADISQGMYFLGAYNRQGALTANAKFLKE